MEIDRTKYLNRKTVNGKLYVFFRHKGKLTPLPADETSDEFKAAYDAAMLATKCALVVANVAPAFAAKDTIRAACEIFMETAKFKLDPDKGGLKPKTKKQYLHTINQILNHRGPKGDLICENKLAEFDVDELDIYTEQIAQLHGFAVADAHRSMIGNIFTVCRPHKEFGLKGKANPTEGSEQRYEVTRHTRAWSPQVQADFMAVAADNIKLAKIVLHYTTLRGSDGVAIKWTDYVTREDRDGNSVRCILVRPEKTDGAKDCEPRVIECVQPLIDALDAAPRVAETILVDSSGQSWADANSLSKAIHRTLIEAGHGDKGLSMHGLRATGATELADLGIDDRGIMAFTQHADAKQVKTYTEARDRRVKMSSTREAWDAKLAQDARPKLRVVS